MHVKFHTKDAVLKRTETLCWKPS